MDIVARAARVGARRQVEDGVCALGCPTESRRVGKVAVDRLVSAFNGAAMHQAADAPASLP
jgi:hypothetical protein